MGPKLESRDSRGLGTLMLDLEGTALTAAEAELIEDQHVGGIIFFARNFQDLEQLRRFVAEIRAIRPDLLLTVDQEGGRVQRFREGFTRLPAMQTFRDSYKNDATDTLARVKNTGWLMAAELISAGIDLSFAPVLDVDDDHCSVIANRSFSSDPREVIELAGAFIAGMHEAGMATTGKHFPGHGSVTEDSHLALPVDQRPFGDVEATDMQPFLSLQSQLDALMPAHIQFPQVDSDPVGFSDFWLQTVVRQRMGYDGVLFSDDLSMAATESHGGYSQRAELALNAGCDMVLVCNNRAGALEVLRFLRDQQRPLSPRLGQLRRRREWDRKTLESLPRWRETKTFLEKLAR